MKLSTRSARARPADAAGLGRLAGWAYDHRRRVLLAWVVSLIALIGLALSWGSTFSSNFAAGNSASQQAQNLLAARFPAQAGDTADIVVQTAAPLTNPVNASRMARLVAAVGPLPHVTSVRSPLAAGAGGQISADRRIGFAVVQFDATADNLPASSIDKVIDVARGFSAPGFTVALGGSPISQVVSASPGSSTGIGVVAAIVIMLVAFGSVVAMGLPIITALAGVGMGFGVVDAVSHVLSVPSFGTELMAMIGLGVGIDYSLFVVTRYRQFLTEGCGPRDATVAAMATAGKAVLLAGSTVVISLLGLLVVQQPSMDGLAVGSVVAVLLVMVGALTLLPAMLGFAGRGIDRLRIPGLTPRVPATHRGFWWRWSRTVMRRPWICAAVALAALVVLAVPLLSMRLGFSDAGNDPPNLTTRQAYDALARGFGPGFNGPLLIITSQPPGSAVSLAVVHDLDRRLSAVPGIAQVSPPDLNLVGDAAVIVAYPSTGPQAAQTASLVASLRSGIIPSVVAGTKVSVLVGGETAASIDASSYLAGRLPWVIALVIALAFVLLLAVFRSVAIPVTAAVMNIVSIGAAYGVIVAVYQWGWLSSLFAVSRTGPIDPWIPLMMFTIVFGLSMDYEVFLLSRVREEWNRDGVNERAVAAGLSGTARVITAAALIMVCVFASFIINDPLRVINIFALGLATAIFVDATLVRMVLVPAIMRLLGRVNWWMPAWLDRAVPILGAEIDPAPAPPGQPGTEMGVTS